MTDSGSPILFDCPRLRQTLRQAATVIGLGLALWLTAWLVGCAQPDINASPATIPAAPTASAAQAEQTPAPSHADRLTAWVVRAVPMASMLQTSLDMDPNWPVGKKTSKVSASQLQCLRQRLSPEGYQESRREAVDKFIKRHPDQVQDSIDVLEQGGADVMASAFRAGLKENRTGRDVEPSSIAQNFTPEEMRRFSDLTAQDKYEPLRKLLIGISNFPLGRNRGALVGKRIGLLLMRDAMDHCQVPMSALR